MTLTALIENELHALNTAKQRALARGQWLKAHDIETLEQYLPKLRKRLASECPEPPTQMVPP